MSNNEEKDYDHEEMLYDMISRLQNEVHDLAVYIRELHVAIWHDCFKPEDDCINGVCQQHGLLTEVRQEMKQEALGMR